MKLTVLSGVSGSGKSTLAQSLAGSSTSIISHDEIRDSYPGLSSDEVTVKVVRTAGTLLLLGQNVVIDACNLHPHDRLRWEAVAWALDAELQWIQLETPFAVCVERDRQRPKPVGEYEIMRQSIAPPCSFPPDASTAGIAEPRHR